MTRDACKGHCGLSVGLPEKEGFPSRLLLLALTPTNVDPSGLPEDVDYGSKVTLTLWLTSARKEAKPTEARPVEPRLRPDRVRCRA